jgi:hypothetical protein
VSVKNKWKKQIPSDAASFRRPKGSARPGNAILIVTEGLVSEPAYFMALKRRLALQTLEIEVQPGGMGDPQKLVEYAVGLREARRREARNGTLSLSKALDFDEVWIVFDTDVPLAHGRLQAGLVKAVSKKIQVAHSTPCFEFWLLLHKTYTTAPMLKCADAVARLESTLTSRYSKASQDAASIIPPLLEGLDTAMANAAKIRLHHSAHPDPEAIRAMKHARADDPSRPRVLVSVKGATEGIDLPNADLGMIVASTSSVLQRIQTPPNTGVNT